MTAILLAAVAAFLFGAMAVFVRIGLRRGFTPEEGTLFTVGPALVVTFAYAAAHGQLDLAQAWPFLLAGLLAPGLSQLLFTLAVRDAGASRASVMVGTAPLFAVAIALVFLDEPVVGGLLVGAALIVAGGIVLVVEPSRQSHIRRIGLLFAVGATVVFATRDALIRWLGTEATDVEPALAAFATVLSGVAVIVAFCLVRGTRPSARAARAFAPAAACYGLSYLCLFEAFYRGRVSVVSPIIATEALWGVTISWLLLRRHERVGPRLFAGAALVVAGGVLIGVFR